ncbi:MAG TPA: hypothetical protein VJ724_12075 [Tahibacter sp.]|nr:hypothetical protein [Tahibacter sp.]
MLVIPAHAGIQFLTLIVLCFCRHPGGAVRLFGIYDERASSAGFQLALE